MTIQPTNSVRIYRSQDEKNARRKATERMARWRAENRKRPDSRVCDQAISESVAELVRQLEGENAVAFIERIHRLASDGLVRMGYDEKLAAVMIARRIKSKADGRTGHVACAARDRAKGVPVGGFFLRNPVTT